MRNAFTIAELMIVACIIGILAALVVPLVQHQSTEAREAAARDNLRVLRSAIELYAANNSGTPPGYKDNDRSNPPTGDDFLDQTTVQERYMQSMPENPFNDRRSMLVILDGEAFPSEATGDFGWVYKPSSNTIRLDWQGQDDDGTRYFDY